ncbi:MAG: NPCBM/NEW2 domain-containing protein, partial [Actinomycetes bacterium]
LKQAGVRFAPGGSESFEVSVPAGAGLVLRKSYLLDKEGHTAEVLLDGKPVGTWNLLRTSADLSSGLRESVFPLTASAVGGKAKVAIELRYPKGGTTARWTAFEYRGGAFPLTAVGAVHADQNVGAPRPGRNTVGGPLKVGEERFGNGIGCFAMSLQEFSLGGRFKRFTAKVGVDAVTEGRGSVLFEVYGDGKKLWASPVTSGLDPARAVDVSVEGVDRLRLVVGDAGDGNRYDVADWCDPVLQQ